MHALLAGEVSEWPGLDMVAAHHDGARSARICSYFVISHCAWSASIAHRRQGSVRE